MCAKSHFTILIIYGWAWEGGGQLSDTLKLNVQNVQITDVCIKTSNLFTVSSW